MKVRVFKVFGREVLRIENHYEATVSDVVRAMIQQRAEKEEVEYFCECSCDEEDDDDEDEEMLGRFADMTERIVWDSRTDHHPFPMPLFDKPEDEDEAK
jgi:hypothetical protein